MQTKVQRESRSGLFALKSILLACCIICILLCPATTSTQYVSALQSTVTPTQIPTDNYPPISRDNAKNIREVARFGRGNATSSAWSPDGKWIAIGTDQGAWLYKADDLNQEPRLLNPDHWIKAVTFTPDSNTIILGGRETQFWDVVTGELKQTFSQDGDITFGDDGILISTFSGELWNLSTSQKLGQTSCSGVASPDAKLVVCASNPIRFFDPKSGQQINVLNQPDTSKARFSPDGKLLAVASGRGVWLWDVKSRRIVYKLQDQAGNILDVAFNHDGTQLASSALDGSALGGLDGTIYIWDVKRGQKLKVLQTGKRWPDAIAFSPDSSHLVTSGIDQPVRTWDLQSGLMESTVYGYNGPIFGLALSPDDRTLVAGDSIGIVSMWDIPGKKVKAWLTGNTDLISAVSFSPDGKQFASAGWDETIRWWDANTGNPLDVWNTATLRNRTIAYSPDGKLVALGDGTGQIQLWDVQSGRVKTTFTPFSETVARVIFSPNGSLLAASDWAGHIQLWNVEQGKLQLALAGHPFYRSIYPPVEGLAFSPDGTLLASGGWDEVIRLWDTKTGNQLDVLEGHEFYIEDVAFSPDGQLLASAGADRVVRLWDMQTRQTIAILSGHTDELTHVLWSSRGDLIITSSRDGTIRLWAVE